VTVTTGTGLDAQIGFAAESTYGTAVTVTRFLEFNSESLAFQPTFLEPTGLRSGRKFKRVGRVVQSRKGVSGDIALEHANKGMGLLWKHALGSSGTATQVAATTAYEQIHTPGDFLGKFLTVQVGRPQPSDGVVKPFTYKGCKFTGWSFGLSDNEIPTLTLNVDGRDEDTATALATASYTAGAGVFNFSQATLKLGGTAATASGKITVTGGTAVATVIRSISFQAETPMATERFGVGNAGLKSQPLENANPTVTGSLEAEFNKAELYDAFQANTTTAMVLEFTGAANAIETGHTYVLRFTIPAAKFKAAAPSVSGPDIVSMSTSFEAYDDETNAPFEVYIKSTDTVI
jgi:hypothetical protein